MPPPVPVMLPYFRDPAELPGPLPTQEEVLNAPKSELSPRRNAWGDGAGVCVIRGIYLVKFDVNVTENEGNALLFIEKTLRIPAPRLYAMYRGPPSAARPGGLIHLVMEYLPGVDLESLWCSLPTQAKSSIACQLQSIFAQVRSLSPPSGFIGGVCGGKMPDPLFATVSPDREINGPFRTEDQVGLALAHASRSICEQNDGRQHRSMSDFFHRHLPAALNGHGIKLTHGDLYLRNILVDKVPTTSSTRDGDDEEKGTRVETNGPQWNYRVTGIVDWELAGWYPAYWEYAAALARFQWDSDWLETVDAIIKPYPLEASMFLLVLRDLRF